jgi:O-antigen ligase
MLAGFNILQETRVATASLVTLAIASAARALLQLFDFGITTDVGGRISLMGQNENYGATVIGTGVIILVGLTYGRPKSVVDPRFLVWPFLAITGIAMVQTGSRTGLVAVVAGLIWFMFSGNTLRHKLTNLCVAATVVVGLAAISYSNEMMRQRWLDFVQRADMSKRERLYPMFLEMFYEKPVFGWGPFSNNKEGGRRMRLKSFRAIGAHSLPLDVLTATGIVGAVPFAALFWTCVYSAWTARHGPHGSLPMALIISVIVGNIGGSRLYSRLFWFTLTYAMACGAQAIAARKGSFRRKVEMSESSASTERAAAATKVAWESLPRHLGTESQATKTRADCANSDR